MCVLQTHFDPCYIGYSQANQQTSKKKTTLLDKEIICSVGTVRYNLDKALALHYPVEDDFYFAVTHLPVEYLEEDYMSFLESWGTVSGSLST